MKIKNPQIETDHIIQSSDFQRTEKQIPQKPKNHKWPNQSLDLTVKTPVDPVNVLRTAGQA